MQVCKKKLKIYKNALLCMKIYYVCKIKLQDLFHAVACLKH